MSIPREGSRDTARGIVISKYPDVCRSPTVPVPYTIVGRQSDDAGTAATVRMTGQRAHKQSSIITQVSGDEPGTGLGVKSGTVGSVCHRKSHSASVRIEGEWATRHGDEWWMNNKNTVGKLTWVESTETFEATPPLAEGPPAGEGPDPSIAFLAPTEYAFVNDGAFSQGRTSGTTGSSPGTPRGGYERPPKPEPKSRWWRRFAWARRATGAGLAAELFFHQNPAYFADMPTFDEEEASIIAEAEAMIRAGVEPRAARAWAEETLARKRRADAELVTDTPPPDGRTDENVRVTGQAERDEECRKTIYIDSATAPESAQHILDAQAAGQPNPLTLMRAGKRARRRAAMRASGLASNSVYDRDEYPPATFLEGGATASVRYVPYSDNRNAGQQIGQQIRDVPDGCIITMEVR